MLNYKQAIVLRTDLELGKGKLVAQGSHASLAAYLKAGSVEKKAWELGGQKKIVLKVKTEKELLEHFEGCRDIGLKPALIRDAGHTQIPSGTITGFGVGPADEKDVDKILGELKLL
ncbi:MAG: peptidyl-tRNA hydrolase [bacterium]|nr:peptidyl-tRNA hydrolase [bacterium]